METLTRTNEAVAPKLDSLERSLHTRLDEHEQNQIDGGIKRDAFSL